MPITVLIAIVALLGGGASVAAEHALPGDVLYPIKVNVIEEVRANFSFSAEDKALWEATRAERRLEEAAELSIQEDVNVDARARIEANFKAFADRVQERIEALKADGDVEGAATVASRFETALTAHDRILAALATHDAESRAETQSLAGTVKSELRETVKIRTSLEEEIASQSSTETSEAADGKINAAGNVIASVQAYIQNKQDMLGADAVIKAQERMTAAQNIVVQAQAKFDAKAYGEAFNLAQSAIRTAQEARTLIEAQVRIDADIRASVSPSPASSSRATGSPHVESSTEGQVNINLGL